MFKAIAVFQCLGSSPLLFGAVSVLTVVCTSALQHRCAISEFVFPVVPNTPMFVARVFPFGLDAIRVELPTSNQALRE